MRHTHPPSFQHSHQLGLMPILSPVAFPDDWGDWSLCHPAQRKGVKEGKLESDVLKLKITPAKAKLCRNQ